MAIIGITDAVWGNILPFIERPQLGLNLSLVSHHFDVLVDNQFDSTELINLTELMVCRLFPCTVAGIAIIQHINIRNKTKFPMPEGPLRQNIRFTTLSISFLDRDVIAFLNSNQQLFDRGIALRLCGCYPRPERIWDVVVQQIWPILSTLTIRNLQIDEAQFNILRRRISPTLLTDLANLESFWCSGLLPDAVGDDQANATAAQALSMWLHTPSADGHPKQLRCQCSDRGTFSRWVDEFKQAFLSATTSVSFALLIYGRCVTDARRILPFELVNEQTQEMLTFEKTTVNTAHLKELVQLEAPSVSWLMKRRQIGDETILQNVLNFDQLSLDHLCTVDLKFAAPSCFGYF